MMFTLSFTVSSLGLWACLLNSYMCLAAPASTVILDTVNKTYSQYPLIEIPPLLGYDPRFDIEYQQTDDPLTQISCYMNVI